MFKRKLTALEHVNPDSVNIDDEDNFRQLILWLEDQKIRHYKIEERKSLKSTDSAEWKKAYLIYLGCLDCPINPTDRASTIDWLLGLAVQLEYSDNAEKFNLETAESVRNRRNEAPKVVNTNPLDALDFQSTEFKDGVNNLAKLLKIKTHPDHLVTLKALSYLLSTRLSKEALNMADEIIPKGTAFPIEDVDLGFETGDPVLNDAGKKLRLLYIHDIRSLQTKINECIVACQEVTANPKTDTRLGKVGR